MPMFCRLTFILITTLSYGLTTVNAADADPISPHVIYDDGLKNGWNNWSWAKKVTLEFPLSEVKPIEVQGGPWEALSLHRTAFSTKGYNKLTFFINGGLEGGQKLMVKLTIDGKLVESSYFQMEPTAKTWAVAEIPLAELDGENKTIDGVVIQAMGEAFKPFYVTRIQFE